MTIGLPEDQLLERRVSDDSASLGIAYALAIFLGPFGAHRLYLGFRGTAFCMTVLTVLGFATLSLAVGLVPLAAMAVWWIADILRLRRLHGVYMQQFRRRLSVDLAIR